MRCRMRESLDIMLHLGMQATLPESEVVVMVWGGKHVPPDTAAAPL